MTLTNTQYDDIMRSYEKTRLRHEHEFRQKAKEAYARFPRLAEIDAEVSSLSLKKARINLGAEISPDFDLTSRIRELSAERLALLETAGFKNGLFEPEYDCPFCKDTGYINNKKCSCFKQASIRLVYSQSRLNEILELENFDTYSLEWYSDKLINPSTKLTARQTAEHALKYAHFFVEHFDNFHNICLFGATGVGKTFLTHCIAKELLDRGISVLYLTAFELITIFEENTFHQTAESKENSNLIFDCDLLIIDDLGANTNNSFINSQLFNCINERLLTRKSVIISTNLSISGLRETYSDRLFSRIMSNYQRLYLFGEDIRTKKKLSGGSPNVKN